MGSKAFLEVTAVPASTWLERYDRQWPHLIDRRRLTHWDGFAGHSAGPLVGLDLPVGGVTWETPSQLDVTPGSDGGYVTANTSGTNRFGLFNQTENDCDICGLFRFEDAPGAASSVGLALRYTSTTQHFRIVLQGNGSVVLQRREATSISLASSSIPIVSGRRYGMKLSAIGTAIRGVVQAIDTDGSMIDDPIILAATDDTDGYDSGTDAGFLLFSSTANRMHEIAAAAYS